MIRFHQYPGNSLVYVKIWRSREFTQRAIRQGFFQLGKDLHKTADKEILRRPKGGRTYIIRGASGSRRRHVASAPGETHANLTGKLRRSIGWHTPSADFLEFGYGVSGDGKGPPAPDYASYVEFGTGRMASRPSLRNAIKATTRNAEVYFSAAIAKEFA